MSGAGHDHAHHGHDHSAHAHSAHSHGDHSHDSHAGHHLPPAGGGASRSLTFALLITGGFLFVELVVGLWSSRLVLLADAGHMAGDATALAIALYAARLASRPRSRSNTYGYRRAEVLGALINGVALGVGAVWIVIEAISRLSQGDATHKAPGAVLAVATFGLIANLVAAFVLHRGHDDLNVRAAFLHVLGDALGSVAAIIASVGVLFWNIYWLDAIASILISMLIVWSTLRLLREVSSVLMEASPRGLNVGAVETTIRETPGVADLHDLHVWSLTPRDAVLTCHVVIGSGYHGTDVAQDVARRLQEMHQIGHATIQPEAPEPGLVHLRRSRSQGPLA